MAQLYEHFESGENDDRPLSASSGNDQSFTPSATHLINTWSFKAWRQSGSSGTITFSIRSVSWTGSVLCSGTIAGSSIGTSSPGDWYDISLGVGATITAGSQYFTTGVITGDYTIRWRENTTGGYAGGNMRSGTIEHVNEDNYFREYGPDLPSMGGGAFLYGLI